MELSNSLTKLRTDHFDLYQLHAVATLEDVDKIMGEGGAIEALVQARREGLTRCLGFSAHTERTALALMTRFSFDSVLFPLNWVCWYESSFGLKVLQEAKRRGIGILALKSLAKRKWREGEQRKWSKCWYAPVESYEEASLALRFTLSPPVTAAVSPGHAELLWWACDTAECFEPLPDKEARLLTENSRGLEPIFVP